jgi:hypothetical protein
MIKERIPISGDLGSKVKQLMEYAGGICKINAFTVQFHLCASLLVFQMG